MVHARGLLVVAASWVMQGCGSASFPDAELDDAAPDVVSAEEAAADSAIVDDAPPPLDDAPPPLDGAPPPPPDGAPPPPLDAGAMDASSPADAAATCALQANTTPSGTVTPKGCAVLSRDTSSCRAARIAQGLSGFWLDFSCRVTLKVSGGQVLAGTDSLPDYKSNYFTALSGGDYYPSCNESYPGANPNSILRQAITVGFPLTTTTTGSAQMHAVVGMAVNGVVIFGNRAAPGDDIYREALTFDRCGAHPQKDGYYHYHGEPYAVSYDDSRFIGVLRDGYPIYGRRDPGGALATGLDVNGGHVGVTAHSGTPVYHYHLNEQTSTNPLTVGQKQWFLSTGRYMGTFSTTCVGCGM